MKLKLILIALTIFVLNYGYSQQDRNGSPSPWKANWIAPVNESGTDYGVFYFRKSINLSSVPVSFKIFLSADNRYKFYVNGKLVSIGPTRGDTFYWNYETVDLAPYLNAGKNIISALVFNEGQFRPEAQITLRTGLIIQGASEAEEVINTDATWRCIPDKAYQPIPGYFFSASKGQFVDMNKTISDWNTANFDDSKWPFAINLFQGKLKGMSDGFGWMLVPSPLPQMELTYQRIPLIREATGINVPSGFPASKSQIVVPPNSKATLLLDQTVLTNAYVTLDFSGGKNAGISMGFAESLFDDLSKHGRRKGNRSEVKDKDFQGRIDSLVSSGKVGQTFTTLYFRTFRYVLITVKTANEALTIDDIYGTFTGYPFKQRAVFKTDNPEINNIREIGWRTARLCAIETYFDCPYYEQLQYIGDTRIQAMVSYYEAGNDTLARHAINLIDHSRLTEGVTQSRWPTHSTQVIPGFSLWYIGMLYDYWMYRDDNKFVSDKLAGERAILDFFSKLQGSDGSLHNIPYWTFVDWAGGNGWDFGGPPKGADGSSAIFDIHLLWAYQWAAEMEKNAGMSSYTTLYKQKAEQLRQTIQKKYWSETKQMYAETVEKNSFSQHTNSLAILTGVANKKVWKILSRKILEDKTLTQCSIYFKYYMHMALTKAGLGNDYLSWLDVWRKNIKLGLTTWAEEPDAQSSRSDCHAWGSSPNIEFYRTVLGVDSEAAGFSKIRIEPHLGNITDLQGSIPHPNGVVEAIYQLKNGKWDIRISIPAKTSGVFIWKGKDYSLKAGVNIFEM